MDKFFEELKKLELRRKENMFYTLGDDGLDKLFDLKQSTAVFAPEDKVVKKFAAVSYLFGLAGYVASNFTAIPMGYLVTYKKGNESQTVVISGDFEYYREILIDNLREKLNDQSLTEEEKEIFSQGISALEDNTRSLEDICLVLNSEIQKLQQPTSLTQDLENAKYPFSSAPDSLNLTNCNNNHVILGAVCKDLLGSQASENDVKELYDNILNNWILNNGYFTYLGHDRTGAPKPQDGQILNNRERMEELFKILSTKLKDPTARARVCPVINMCSTDYTADIVYAVMEEMTACTEPAKSRDKLTQIVPKTPSNSASVQSARKHLDELGNFISIQSDLNK